MNFKQVCFATLLWCSAIPFLSAQEKPLLSGAQRKEMQELLSQLRKLKGQPEERQVVIDHLAAMGTLPLHAAEEILAKELQSALLAYRPLFARGAMAALAKQVGGKDLQEVTDLRTRVLDLQKGDNLTKERIVEIGDPALERLMELLLVNREEVLEQSPALTAPREALLKQGLLWDHLQQRIKETTASVVPTTDEAAVAPANPTAAASDAGVMSDDQTWTLFADYLAQEEEQTVFLSMPMDPMTRQIIAYNNQLASRFDPEEARCMADANLVRCLLGLKVLQIDPLLVAAAKGHSADMERLQFFAHDSPVPGKTSPWDRAKLAGTSAAAENIAAGVKDGVQASRMWWHSPGHHRNLLGDQARIGVGKEDKRWTQMFGQ